MVTSIGEKAMPAMNHGCLHQTDENTASMAFRALIFRFTYILSVLQFYCYTAQASWKKYVCAA